MARPAPRYVRTCPAAHRPPPQRISYRPYYTRWYVHPWYRSWYATRVVVAFSFGVDPWSPVWVPPSRAGYVWVPGVWVGPTWIPGYWAPVNRAVAGYVYVPGYWDGPAYVEGFYRVDRRDDGGWSWVDGYYLDDGTYVRGHWAPTGEPPAGYTWEPGFWDGQTWVDGFWRPTFRTGYAWVSSFHDGDGVFHAGYWAPVDDVPGMVWIPGWFDGAAWVEGYWVDQGEYETTDVQAWSPDEGWDAGWDEADVDDPVWIDTSTSDAAARPLGIPVGDVD